ncbi:MAG: ABC transporter ATP-binding protein [Pseudomonadales bacterium]|nr:ABC transporter ATP-binding protein [Pseudomonadales bacterium]
MPFLEIRDLRVSIDDTPIIKSISLNLGAGEILGVAGESGSGKTMMALAIASLLPARAVKTGQICLDGVNLSDANEAEYCKIRGQDIGLVFQEPMSALNPMMTIGRQVAETVRIHKKIGRREAQKMARDTLAKVGLPSSEFSLDRYPHSLSGGQRQRVAIAIAIALQPKLLIADEPTTALDVTTQAEILTLFKQLVYDQGTSLIFVTHDLAVVAQTADYVAVLKDGEIIDQGNIAAVFKSSRHAYTQQLMENAVHVPHRASRTKSAADKSVFPEMGDSPVLEVSNIVHEYHGERKLLGGRKVLRAVDQVSLQIYPNENVALVGESGCGKSTLLRAILGLEKPQSGEIKIFGQHFPTDKVKEMRKLRRLIQVVFQDPFGSFDPRWRVSQLISENFHLFDSPPEGKQAKLKIDQILESVGLRASDADKYPHEFSGGQRQRIAIARALITEPSIIALDEAVSALDVSIRARILDLLAELSDRLEVSYLFVTHDLSVVRSVTDRILVMKAGKIVEQGETAEVFASPKNAYTIDLLKAVPNLSRELSDR